LIDGIGDLGIESLQGKTPLQHAVTPTFDAIAASGLCGLMDPVETGLACGSDTAHMNIFGYNPFKEYRGRGSFETIGSGLAMVKKIINNFYNVIFKNIHSVHT
jgi:2,3-diphosphopglycerate-independent phosphoglycerate mutase